VRVSEEDNRSLIAPFPLHKIVANLGAKREDTAPGPDGFPISFYTKFWTLVGPQFAALVDDFTLGLIDIKHLDYGVMALISKVSGADNIWQFRPLTLINVSFCLLVKGFATRLAPVAHKVINPNQ
jgi:hypothetical protein